MMDPRQTTPPRGPDPGGRASGGGWDGEHWDWDPPYDRRPGFPDLSPLFALLDALRRMVPPELQEQFAALQREFLLTIRALIDWYLERLDARTRPVEVEEIQID